MRNEWDFDYDAERGEYGPSRRFKIVNPAKRAPIPALYHWFLKEATNSRASWSERAGLALLGFVVFGATIAFSIFVVGWFAVFVFAFVKALLFN